MSDRSLFVRCGEGNALFGTAGGLCPPLDCGMLQPLGLKFPGVICPRACRRAVCPPAALSAPRSIHMHFIHMHFTLLYYRFMLIASYAGRFTGRFNGSVLQPSFERIGPVTRRGAMAGARRSRGGDPCGYLKEAGSKVGELQRIRGEFGDCAVQ